MMSEREHLGSPELSVDSEGIARLVFDAPGRSANVLTVPVMDTLSKCISQIRAGCDEGMIRGVLIHSGKPSSFIVGADVQAINEIANPNFGADWARRGQVVYLELERLPVPTVAAIHGACMGGGTELALACRYRLASDGEDTRIALPEVQLGILPFWGGTTRLPRLIGIRPALDLLLSGKPVDGRKAKRIGLVDSVLPHNLFVQCAEAFLLDRMQSKSAPARPKLELARRLVDGIAPGRRIVISLARRSLLKRTGGHYPAPLRILDVVRSSMGRSLEKALELEALAAGELIASRVSKNLIHVFNLREAARKGAGAVGAAPVGRIRQIGIVGAGTIGGGIAQLAAQRGIRVRLKDVRQEAISLALKHASGVLNSSVKRHKLSRWNADEAMGRISGGLDYAGFGPTGLVVEVVGERMEVTKAVLREIESSVSESCVIVTNTSSLSVTEMAGALNSPRRFAGMHFFNPVHRMPLVEIVQGEQTDRDIVAIVHALSVRLGKVPVVVRDGPGLLVNRILGPYLNEAGFLLAEGAGIDDIDGTAVAFGMPRGPLQLIDEIGIDIVRHTGQTLHNAFGDRLAPSPALLAIGESGRLGRKGGSGFYTYQNGQQFRADRTVHDLIGTRGAGAESAPDAEEISDRLVLSMINEAAGVLSDGVAFSAADVDFAMIMGTGFPSFRGGLLRLADEMHPQSLLERLEHYEKSCGARFSAAPLLRELARDDRGFYEAYPKGLPA